MIKKKMFCLLSFILIVLSLSFCVKNEVVFADNSSEIVMEVNSKRILFGKNIDDKKYMASTTKILTAIIIIENCNLEDTVTVSSKSVGIEGSSIYLEAGEILTVKDLLYGLMLRSGNDCAETLALYCSNSIENFAILMNESAKKMGATDSNFVNPHGLHNDNHYTTARDLAIISCYAIKNPVFKEIVSTKQTIIKSNLKSRLLINKNKMLKEFDGATGIKTGFTKKAGRCLVSSCEKNGLELVSVVLNCPPMFEESKAILSRALNNYKPYKITESDNIIDFIPIENSNTKCGAYVKEDLILPLTESERLSLKIEYELPEILKLPIKKDSEIGFIKIYCENNLIFTQKIYTIINIDY